MPRADGDCRVNSGATHSFYVQSFKENTGFGHFGPSSCAKALCMAHLVHGQRMVLGSPGLECAIPLCAPPDGPTPHFTFRTARGGTEGTFGPVVHLRPPAASVAKSFTGGESAGGLYIWFSIYKYRNVGVHFGAGVHFVPRHLYS